MAICVWRVSNESRTLNWNASISCEKQWGKKKKKKKTSSTSFRVKVNRNSRDRTTLSVEMEKERRWEEKDKDRKKGETTTTPAGVFAFTESDMKQRSPFENCQEYWERQRWRRREGNEHNCKHTLAVRRAWQTSRL